MRVDDLAQDLDLSKPDLLALLVRVGTPPQDDHSELSDEAIKRARFFVRKLAAAAEAARLKAEAKTFKAAQAKALRAQRAKEARAQQAKTAEEAGETQAPATERKGAPKKKTLEPVVAVAEKEKKAPAAGKARTAEPAGAKKVTPTVAASALAAAPSIPPEAPLVPKPAVIPSAPAPSPVVRVPASPVERPAERPAETKVERAPERVAAKAPEKVATRPPERVPPKPPQKVAAAAAPAVTEKPKKVVPLRPPPPVVKEAPAAAITAPPAKPVKEVPAAAPPVISRPVPPPPPPVEMTPPLPPAPFAGVPPPPPAKRELLRLPESVTVAELAEKMRRKAGEVIKVLVESGVMATINALLDPGVVKKVADGFNFDVEFRTQGVELVEEEIDPSRLRPRPPVVTVMGHVDHGKTSLLDAIRRTKVAEREHGGITQHIGAYQVETSHGKVTFLDTPGHEAFTAMRARGAQVTDIVILVVAADDGVMPQTTEAINHAKAANVPILVAVNKIDKPGADPERVKRELANLELVPEEWGGRTIFVETSAKRGTGVESLVEMTALQAEIMELKADPTRAARGVIVEARLERGRGPVATALIQQGTLQEGDPVVAGLHFGRVRAMFDAARRRVKEAGPAMPVEILGLSGVPHAGDTLAATGEERRARQIALGRQAEERRKIQPTARVTLEDLHKQIKAGEVKELRLIVKADVQGSVEALVESLERLSTEEVKLKVIHGSVGTITETDVMLASASNAIVLGFNVRAEPKAAGQAQAEGVDIRNYTVIYEALNDLKAAMEGMLSPEIREITLGRAQVKALFPISKVGTVTGCQVIEGKVTRTARVRLRRDGQVLAEGTLASLKRFKDDAREVLQGFECGVGLAGITDIQIGDTLEFFTTEEVARTL